jgi:hypothetical protein
MATESDRQDILEAHLTSAQRLAHASTIVPAAYFDGLVASLDEPDDAPGLARAVRNVRRRKRIQAA